MLKLCEDLKIALLIPCRDEELPLFSKHKNDFARIGTTVMISDPGTIKICQDKKLFIDFCAENDFAAPRQYADPGSKGLRFPVFLKPRIGKGGKRAIKVESAQALKSALSDDKDLIIQEFIEAPEYTVDIFADLSGNIISAVPRERMRVFGGESFVSRTSKNRSLIDESTRLASRLKLIGHNTIQCFLDRGTVKFIEVNPRFGGAANLGFASGVDTPLLLIKLLKCEKIPPAMTDFRDNYVMLRYTEDLFMDLEKVREKRFK